MMVFLIIVCFVIHAGACLFYYIAALKGFGPGTWVYAAGLSQKPLGERYVAAIYWATTTVSTARRRPPARARLMTAACSPHSSTLSL